MQEPQSCVRPHDDVQTSLMDSEVRAVVFSTCCHVIPLHTPWPSNFCWVARLGLLYNMYGLFMKCGVNSKTDVKLCLHSSWIHKSLHFSRVQGCIFVLLFIVSVFLILGLHCPLGDSVTLSEALCFCMFVLMQGLNIFLKFFVTHCRSQIVCFQGL